MINGWSAVALLYSLLLSKIDWRSALVNFCHVCYDTIRHSRTVLSIGAKNKPKLCIGRFSTFAPLWSMSDTCGVARSAGGDIVLLYCLHVLEINWRRALVDLQPQNNKTNCIVVPLSTKNNKLQLMVLEQKIRCWCALNAAPSRGKITPFKVFIGPMQKPNKKNQNFEKKSIFC